MILEITVIALIALELFKLVRYIVIRRKGKDRLKRMRESLAEQKATLEDLQVLNKGFGIKLP